jgi:hypothetical protein
VEPPPADELADQPAQRFDVIDIVPGRQHDRLKTEFGRPL